MIPNKSNFKFQELTPITGVKPYVIRFWETEFEDISPVISDQGQKLYARKDVEAILKIKKLLFEDKLSIPQAKALIKSNEIEIQESTAGEEKGDDRAFIKDVVDSALAIIREIKTTRGW